MQYEGISAIYEACFALTSPGSRACADFGVSDCSVIRMPCDLGLGVFRVRV